MCVVSFALYQHPRWPIILLGNRDEFHGRASAPLQAWDDGSGIIAGRDLVGGGTWLGVQPALGRIVVVTNVASGAGPDPAKQSRGELVRDLLTHSGRYAAPQTDVLGDFNGFTVMMAAPGGAMLLTNRPAPTIAPLPVGVHTLANMAVGTHCPRADRLAAVMHGWNASANAEPDVLLDAMTHEAEPPLFLRNPAYGTRCSTLVLVDALGMGRIIERRYDKGGTPDGETALSFEFG